jgi:hypothetical protein
MATEPVYVDHTVNKDVYFAIFDPASGTVYDFSDHAFKTLAAAVTPFIVAAEQRGGTGLNRSRYRALANLTHINPSQTIKVLEAQAFERLTGSPDLGADLFLGAWELRVAAGLNVKDLAASSAFQVEFEANVKSTEGTTVQLVAWLTFGNEKIAAALTDACAVICREHGSGVNLFSVTLPATAAGTFEAEQEDPGFTDDRAYLFDVTIIYGGVSYTGTHARPVIGGE